MRTLYVLLAVLVLAGATLAGQPRTTLDNYVVDVEGGNAVLFVTPAGESVLIDTGNADGATRDAARIMEAARDAGLTQIDHLIITHWHADHFGGLAELAKQIPIREFIDHGPNVQPGAAADQFLANVYPGLTKGATHRVAKPGDRIPLNGIDWQIVASAGAVPTSPLSGAGARNPECATFEPELNFKDFDEFFDFAYRGGWLTPIIEALGLHRPNRVLRVMLNAWLFPVRDHHSIVIALGRKTGAASGPA